MSDTEQRFSLSMRQSDTDEPGLIRERDGTVWLVNPDGTRTQLPGSASGVPDGGSTGEVLTKASNADGDADWEAGGGSQPQVLGPYPLAFDDAGISDAGVVLATLQASLWVLAAWLRVTTEWASTPTDLYLNVSLPLTAGTPLVSITDCTGSNPLLHREPEIGGQAAPLKRGIVLTESGSQLIAQAYASPLSAGAADCYALVLAAS